jgi:hypothetical protein
MFKVEGRRFGTDQIGLFNTDNAQCRGVVSGLKQGSEVTIYYDPNGPHKNCIIKPEDHAIGFLVFKKTLALILMVIITLLVFRSSL